MTVYRNLLIISCATDDLTNQILPLITDDKGVLDFSALAPIPDKLTRGVIYKTREGKYEVSTPKVGLINTITFKNLMEADDYTDFESGRALKRNLNNTVWGDKFLATRVVDYVREYANTNDAHIGKCAPVLYNLLISLLESVLKEHLQECYRTDCPDEYMDLMCGARPFNGSDDEKAKYKVSTVFNKQTGEYILHFLTEVKDRKYQTIDNFKWLQLLDNSFASMSMRLLSSRIPHRLDFPPVLVVPSRAMNPETGLVGGANQPVMLRTVGEDTYDYYITKFDNLDPGLYTEDTKLYNIPQELKTLCVHKPLEAIDYWFKEAAHNSTCKNLVSQLKVHYEEINEGTTAIRMLLELSGCETIDELFTEEHINNPALKKWWIELVDAMGDQIVTASGMLRYLGVHVTRVMTSISASNLSKFEDGQAVRKEVGGKILKGVNYTKVDLEFSLVDMKKHFKGWEHNPETSINLTLNELLKEGIV